MRTKSLRFKIRNLKWLGVLIIGIIFSSCSMQKRVYSKGFYTHKITALKKKEIITDNLKLKVEDSKLKSNTEELTASNSTSIILYFKPTDACDTIILKNGAKLPVSIKDANSTDIKYRTCPNNNGLILTIKKADVSSINYGNGRREVFEEEHKYNQPTNLPDDKLAQYNANSSHSNRYENKGKKTNSFGVIGFVTCFIPIQLGLIFAVLNLTGSITLNSGGIAAVSSAWFIAPLILSIISFMLCLIAIIQITKNKETQKGLGMAILGLIVSLIIIMALLGIILSA